MADNFLYNQPIQYEMFSDETEEELKTGVHSSHSQSGNLTERELVVIRLRFGIDCPDEQPWTFTQIGKLFSVTKQRVEQIEQRALRKLRNNPEMRKLRHLVIGEV